MVWKGDATGRLAKSLITFIDQVDAKWPARDKSSDGSIASAEHSRQNPNSDHERNAAGVVTALDLDRDIAAGFSARNLAESLVASRDPRIKYIISNGQIISSKVSPWTWRPYTGMNAHREHIHISVDADPALYDDARPWAAIDIVAPQPITRTPADVRRRMGLATTKAEQRVDAQGRLMVYPLSAGDGGGAYEVAGINERWHPVAAAKLKRMIETGVPDAQVRAFVGDYLGAYTDVADQWTVSWGIESYLRDCVFHRGPTGAVLIMQLALKASGENLGTTGNLRDGVDGDVGRLTTGAMQRQERDPLRFLELLRAAREVYERTGNRYISGGPNRDESSQFWRGLINRFNNALTVAQGFHAEQGEVLPPITETEMETDKIVAAVIAALQAQGIIPKPPEPKPVPPVSGFDINQLMPLLLQSAVGQKLIGGQAVTLLELLPLIQQVMALIKGQALPALPAPEPVVNLPPVVKPPPVVEPVPTAPATTSNVWTNVSAGLAGVLASLGLSATGVIGAPVGPEATTTGMLLPIISMGLAALGIPAPIVSIVGALFNRLRTPPKA